MAASVGLGKAEQWEQEKQHLRKLQSMRRYRGNISASGARRGGSSVQRHPHECRSSCRHCAGAVGSKKGSVTPNGSTTGSKQMGRRERHPTAPARPLRLM